MVFVRSLQYEAVHIAVACEVPHLVRVCHVEGIGVQGVVVVFFDVIHVTDATACEATDQTEPHILVRCHVAA